MYYYIIIVVISRGASDEPCGKKQQQKPQGHDGADDSVEVRASLQHRVVWGIVAQWLEHQTLSRQNLGSNPLVVISKLQHFCSLLTASVYWAVDMSTLL